jgi:hypothetical protein
VLVYCSDHGCSQTTINADRWPDHVRLSDIEPDWQMRCGIEAPCVLLMSNRERVHVRLRRVI